jgi:DNA-binding transcriptional MocR family regulator
VLDLLGALGATPLPVAVDDQGMQPESLADALERRAAAVIVTPRAQNPTGAALTPGRVRALRRVLAQHEDALLVEDDHAGTASAAEPLTLVSRARTRWAVVRSVSKTLGPDLRVAVMTGDAQTLARVEGRQMLGPGWVSTILQRTVATLWEDADVRDLVAHAGAAYEDRRTALIAALSEHGIRAHGRSGLNVWVPVREEAATVEALLAHGWAVSAGERFRLRTAPAVRVTSAVLPVDEAPALAQAIADSQRPGGGRVF